PVGVGIGDGCSRRPVPAIVTRAEGQLVQQIDGRPAVEVYLERLGVAETDVEDFHAFAVEHPLAQPELSGDVRLRHVRDRDEDGALVMATHIPANAAVQFTDQSPLAIVRSAWNAVEGALAPLAGEPARAALAFDCGGRRSALGDALPQEADAIRSSFGPEPPPVAGLFTHGEVGRVRGAKGDRNHALVVVAFA
ncbi:MAG: FIST C-terminal domain-containing protein, partial [Thermoleophilaceae bacterium]|nr:FIST C-terminal domain-containing protein [Thermoleophilaceae bacterium]